jgi:hypothetical protein
MNEATYSGLLARLLYRVMLGTRYLGAKPTCESLGVDQRHDTIERIYVINLDRHSDRWRQMRRELSSLNDRSGKPLAGIARRFSAVDARYYAGPPSSEELQPYYSLADQLFVEPNPLLAGHRDTKAQRVEMTRQEVAVALSHIAVWKLVAASDRPYTLVLEDDVYFRRGFARALDRAWTELMQSNGQWERLECRSPTHCSGPCVGYGSCPDMYYLRGEPKDYLTSCPELRDSRPGIG